MNYELPIPVQLLLRPTADGRTMILGVCPSELELPEQGEVVVGFMHIIPDYRFDPGECYWGMRADQILCSCVPLAAMRQIEPKAAEVARDRAVTEDPA